MYIIIIYSQVGFTNCIGFENYVLKSKRRIKGEQILYYNMEKYKHKGYFDILNNISEHVTLVKLMDSIGNMNRSIGVVVYWIFDSNYEKSLVINR